MKETINYYYNLNPNKINKIFDYYYFYLNNELYYFTPYTRKPQDINAIFDYNKKMLFKNILVNEIINNKDNYILRAYAAPNPALTFFFFVATQRKRTKAKKKKHA